MYRCDVIEFPSNARVAVVNENDLFFFDKKNIYDATLTPRFKFPSSECFARAMPDGLWVNLSSSDCATAMRISTNTWVVESVRNHSYSDWSVSMDGIFYVCDEVDGVDSIVAYDERSSIIKKIEINRLRSGLCLINEYIYARNFEGGVFCLDRNLDVQWKIEKNKKINSNNQELSIPIFYKGILIVNIGEDKTPSRGNFELNAYQHDTGELVWQKILETSPNSCHLVDDKLYVAVGDRLIKIDAESGNIEINVVFNYTTFDGQKGGVSAVYPVDQGLLCFNHQNHFVELRDHRAETILQTIKLPETYSYHLSVKQPVIEHEGKLYFNLGHLVMALNPMKSAVAVLVPDSSAPEYVDAALEVRPSYMVESIKDANGKNGFYVRMEGDNPDKVIRYAHIVLKELAFKSGKTWLIEFESRDHDNAGMIIMEISTKNLAGNRPLSEWKETFSVIKERVEDELSSNDVKAGDGENDFVIDLRVV